MEKKYIVLVYNKIESNNFFKLYKDEKEAIERARFEYAVMQNLQQKFPKLNNTAVCVQLICLEKYQQIDFLKEDEYLGLVDKQD